MLTQGGGDKKEQYTSIRTMTDCICTSSCGAAVGNFALRALECFRQARVVNTLAWNNKIGLVAIGNDLLG